MTFADHVLVFVGQAAALVIMLVPVALVLVALALPWYMVYVVLRDYFEERKARRSATGDGVT